jgi:hypothetical protein
MLYQFGPVGILLMITCLAVLIKLTYSKTRVIIDRTEIFIEMPSSCRSQSITFSSYKNHNTAKGLIGISPNGYPIFIGGSKTQVAGHSCV